MKKIVWIEEMVEIAEKSASSALYSILKRSDEKYITEYAYKHPRFAEDVVRKVAQKLKKNKRILWFSVEVENFESIHNHSAYALIESNSKGKI
jgi:GTP cyclohydrolase I